MRQVSLSGLADIWNYPSSDKNTADLLVLGGVPDDHGQAWRVSALLLQRQLGLACYETAWMMLHKLRRAMVNNARWSAADSIACRMGDWRPSETPSSPPTFPAAARGRVFPLHLQRVVHETYTNPFH